MSSGTDALHAPKSVNAPTTLKNVAPGLNQRRFPDWGWSTVSIVGLLVIWSALTATGWIDPVYLPSPLGMLQELGRLLSEGYKGISIYEHIGASLFRALSGFAIGAAIGIPFGLLSGSTRIGNAMISPLLAFLRPIPPIAFIPMVVLYFGLGELGKVVLIVFTSFNYAQLNAHAGAAGVSPSYLRTARSLGLNRWQIFQKVLIPASIPQIFTGLKVAMALSWAVVVAAELVGAQRGLGFIISDAAQFFQIPVVFIGIALIGVIGLLLNLILNRLEQRLVHW